LIFFVRLVSICLCCGMRRREEAANENIVLPFTKSQSKQGSCRFDRWLAHQTRTIYL